MPRGNPKGVRQARAQRNKGKEGAGRPSYLDDDKIVERLLECAMLGRTTVEASVACRMNRNTVNDWLNRALAELADGIGEEDSKYVRFYYDWHGAQSDGRNAVLKAMMEHKSPQALTEWLKRTDREQEYLDQDKKYHSDRQAPLLELNQHVEGDVQVGLARAKERLDADRKQKALERSEIQIVEGESHEVPEEAPRGRGDESRRDSDGHPGRVPGVGEDELRHRVPENYRPDIRYPDAQWDSEGGGE